MKFSVSVFCTVFATVTVDASDEVGARSVAMASNHKEFEIERHTLTQDSIERVTPMEAVCSMCGEPIRHTGKYWEHVNSTPRHPANPKDES